MTPDDSAVEQALASAPQQVRTFIEEGELADIVVDISHARQLHVDVIGQLAELSRNMLIGLMSPDQVRQELIASGVESAAANLVLADLNEKVFAPLHKQVKSSAQKPVLPVAKLPTLEPQAKASSIPAALPSVPAPVPALRTMSSDMEQAKDAKAPHTEVEHPRMPMMPASAGVVAPPAPPKAAAPVPPRTQTPSSLPGAPAVQDYSADPYREPVE